MSKIITLTIFMCLPFFSMSQSGILKSADKAKHEDWSDEANRKVEVFYKHLSTLIRSDISIDDKGEVAMLIWDLFIDNAEVCDSILLGDKQQIHKYYVNEFLTQMMDLESNVHIYHLSSSNDLFFDVNTGTKIYDITELIKFKMLTPYKTNKTVTAHFISIENPVDKRINFMIKLGNVHFSK